MRDQTRGSVVLERVDNRRIGLTVKRRGGIERVKEVDRDFVGSVGIQSNDDMGGFE